MQGNASDELPLLNTYLKVKHVVKPMKYAVTRKPSNSNLKE